MSTRRPTPAVYRRRRLAVLLVLLLVIGGAVTLALWRPWETPEATAAPSPRPSTPDAATSGPTPTTTADATPEPTPEVTPEASPSPSATSIPVCTSGDVVVTAVTDQASYGAGEKPRLSIELENVGDLACAMNVGTAAQSFTISSGTDVWWRSTDCQTEPSDLIVQLEPGKKVTSAEPLVWDRTRSSVTSCDDDRPAALAGYYNLLVTVGGIDSEERQFRLR
ncbi:MAG: hypothetical protein P0Y48_13360 [Candidatus Microbacterium phytovorans]|uniref:DUF4232 domain-containing protein n=1 Tax=Candidatus Microbacterium phytovorans TaxID=3121374 RepID=A0AAJ6B3W1_9MICO|nr:hypothetical protein [Microbacterium sp.]WEK13429.1 MAG: hypothetical protein P0Y48_13360 [Microbacterium sp.]